MTKLVDRFEREFHAAHFPETVQIPLPLLDAATHFFKTIRIIHPLLYWRSHPLFRNNWKLATVSKKWRGGAFGSLSTVLKKCRGVVI